MAETGHARNVANFATLISYCIGNGGDYKPTNALIEIPAMQALLAQAQAALADVQVKIVPWKNKVADRENIYEGVRPLSTRLLNAFEACGADANKVDNAKTYVEAALSRNSTEWNQVKDLEFRDLRRS